MFIFLSGDNMTREEGSSQQVGIGGIFKQLNTYPIFYILQTNGARDGFGTLSCQMTPQILGLLQNKPDVYSCCPQSPLAVSYPTNRSTQSQVLSCKVRSFTMWVPQNQTFSQAASPSSLCPCNTWGCSVSGRTRHHRLRRECQLSLRISWICFFACVYWE